MVLESVSRSRHAFMKLCTHWRSISDHYCTLFKDIAIFQRECTKSGHTFCKEYHLLWKIRLGITDIGRLYVNKCRTHVLSALCLLYFVSIVAALFLNSANFCRKLGGIAELQNCPQPMPKSPSIWFSKFGDKKAGTSRSHDVGRYESRLINQENTKTSRNRTNMTGQDQTQTQKQTSRPELRAGVKRKARVVMYDVMPVINQD